MTESARGRRTAAPDAASGTSRPVLLLCCRRHVDLCRVTNAICRPLPR